MKVLLGYGVIINNIRIFNPRSIFLLFELDESEEYKDLVDEMDIDGLFDILAFAENIGLEEIMMKIADKSDILDYIFTGTSHSIAFRSRMPWEVTDVLMKLTERDISDEIDFIIKPYLQNDIFLEYTYINLQHT